MRNAYSSQVQHKRYLLHQFIASTFTNSLFVLYHYNPNIPTLFQPLKLIKPGLIFSILDGPEFDFGINLARLSVTFVPNHILHLL